MSTFAERCPEARGAGVETGDGGIRYGDETVPQTTFEPPTPRRPGRPVNVVDYDPSAGCPRCHGIPDNVLSPLAAALANAGVTR